MEAKLLDWKRPKFEAGGGNALVMFVIYGSFTNEVKISGPNYRTTGIPEGVVIRKVSRAQTPTLPFTDGDFGKVLRKQDGSLFTQIENSPECMVIQGEVADPANLNYLRDCIGVVTYFLDHGGIGVADVQQIKMFARADWRRDFFEPVEPKILRHVMVLFSEEEMGAGRWYHTRGMRKFGRSDLSLRNVPSEYQSGAISLCERFIELQALGGRIPESQRITMKSLPDGLTCHHKGSLDDPDFNNVHVEIQFPPEQ